MNPTGLLKLVAALVPIMGNQELGQAIVTEIRAMFTAMQRTADVMVAIDSNLKSIDDRLRTIELHLKTPLDDTTIDNLIAYNEMMAEPPERSMAEDE